MYKRQFIPCNEVLDLVVHDDDDGVCVCVCVYYVLFNSTIIWASDEAYKKWELVQVEVKFQKKFN